jgi:hypothetical protein
MLLPRVGDDSMAVMTRRVERGCSVERPGRDRPLVGAEAAEVCSTATSGLVLGSEAFRVKEFEDPWASTVDAILTKEVEAVPELARWVLVPGLTEVETRVRAELPVLPAGTRCVDNDVEYTVSTA